MYDNTISHSLTSSISFFVPSAIITFVHSGKHHGLLCPDTVTVSLHESPVSSFTLHWTEYDLELEELLDGYTHVPLNEAIFAQLRYLDVIHFIVAHSPQSNSILPAFPSDVLHTIVVLPPALVNDFSVISGALHSNQSSKLCTASSHRSPSIILSSGFSSFRYIHAKFVLLSLLSLKTFHFNKIYHSAPGSNVSHP